MLPALYSSYRKGDERDERACCAGEYGLADLSARSTLESALVAQYRVCSARSTLESALVAQYRVCSARSTIIELRSAVAVVVGRRRALVGALFAGPPAQWRVEDGTWEAIPARYTVV